MVSEGAAKDYRRQMSAPDLVFLTKENDEEIRQRIAPELLAKFDEDQKALAEEAERLRKEGLEQLKLAGIEVPSEAERKKEIADREQRAENRTY